MPPCLVVVGLDSSWTWRFQPSSIDSRSLVRTRFLGIRKGIQGTSSRRRQDSIAPNVRIHLVEYCRTQRLLDPVVSATPKMHVPPHHGSRVKAFQPQIQPDVCRKIRTRINVRYPWRILKPTGPYFECLVVGERSRKWTLACGNRRYCFILLAKRPPQPVVK
jgi:hypothetical protein